jgi:hypothetical protein
LLATVEFCTTCPYTFDFFADVCFEEWDSIQALGVDYRILIRICGFNEILIKTLLASGTSFGRLCFLLRAIEFYQSSAGFFEFLVEFCFSERVVWWS